MEYLGLNSQPITNQFRLLEWQFFPTYLHENAENLSLGKQYNATVKFARISKFGLQLPF
jgi:hypothetical protein